MAKPVIEFDQVSKSFEIGKLGSETLRQDLIKYWKKLTQKASLDSSNHTFWALQDISFSVNEGEVIGIIGRNGSGKSTLMKILSRVLLPTQGHIRGRGKISSILEVGTGFHGELTGLENIYLNAQILGMKKHEVNQKLDEIISFSGIEDFINTPVKRYSSGMYVRLAFSVAAHLDADILILDEVLAVGDADFQKKCLIKMRELASSQGKTTLIISHDMQALRQLCNQIVYLENGKLKEFGAPTPTIAKYLYQEKIEFLDQDYASPDTAPGNQYLRVKRVSITPSERVNQIIYRNSVLHFELEYWNLVPEIPIMVRLFVFSFSGECLIQIDTPMKNLGQQNLHKVSGDIPSNYLGAGSYYFSVYFLDASDKKVLGFDTCLSIDLASDLSNILGDMPQAYVSSILKLQHY